VFHDREDFTTENDIKVFAIMKNAAWGAAGAPVIMKKSKPAHTKTSGYISTLPDHGNAPSSWLRDAGLERLKGPVCRMC
jgi:hypothetical protein